MALLFLFFTAQAPPGDIPGGAITGWTAAGILVSVLSWLFFKHLPSKDAQLERIIKQKDDAYILLVKEFKEERDKDRAQSKEEAKYEREQCQKHNDRLFEVVVKNQDVTNNALNGIARAINSAALASQSQHTLATKAMDKVTNRPEELRA